MKQARSNSHPRLLDAKKPQVAVATQYLLCNLLLFTEGTDW